MENSIKREEFKGDDVKVPCESTVTFLSLYHPFSQNYQRRIFPNFPWCVTQKPDLNHSGKWTFFINYGKLMNCKLVK